MLSKKKFKIAILYLARACGLFRLARVLTAQGVRILGYHGVWLGEQPFKGDVMFIRSRTFKDRLALIKRLGYPVVSLRQAVDGLQFKATLPANPVVITIDDGWFGTYAVMAPALKAAGIPATLYCDTAHLVSGKPVPDIMARYILNGADYKQLSGMTRELYERAILVSSPWEARWQALEELARLTGVELQPYIDANTFRYMTAEQLREAFECGAFDVQLHTHNHTLHDLSAAAVRQEISDNRAALASFLGVSTARFDSFCYPTGIHGGEAAATLAEVGISSSTTTVSGLSYIDTPLQLLPRFLDGEGVSEIEFEAELSGFAALVRAALKRPLQVRAQALQKA